MHHSSQLFFSPMQLSQRVLSAVESQTLAITAKAKAMKAQGIDVISLSAGEPDFPPPQCAKDAVIEAVQKNYAQYTEANGIPELRSAIAEKFQRENGLAGATADTVLVSCGGKHSIFNALLAMCNDGDEVIIPAPYWVSYPAMITMAGAVPVVVTTTLENRYKITPDELRSALTPRTKCVILNSPSNPTGSMYSREELTALADVLADHSCFIISDELYEKITFGSVEHFSIGSLPQVAERVITVNGVSKAYAMTGWRIGYMTGPKQIIKEAAKVQGQSTSNPNSLAQRAALAALLHAEPDVKMMCGKFAERKEKAITLAEALPNVSHLNPDGAFYLFLDISKALTAQCPTSVRFCEIALDEFHVAGVPGEAFGAPGCVRLSFATSEEIFRRGMERLGQALQSIAG